MKVLATAGRLFSEAAVHTGRTIITYHELEIDLGQSILLVVSVLAIFASLLMLGVGLRIGKADLDNGKIRMLLSITGLVLLAYLTLAACVLIGVL